MFWATVMCGKQCKFLENHAGRAFGGGNAGHVLALDADGSGRHVLEAGNLFQQRGLAATRWPNEGYELAAMHLKRNALQCRIGTIGLVDIGDVEDLDVLSYARIAGKRRSRGRLTTAPARSINCAAASSSCQIASISSMLGAIRCIWELSQACHM